MSQELTSNTLYSKENGKYVPISSYQDTDYWRTGTYLVVIRPGCRSIRQMLHVNNADLEAGLHIVGEGILRAMAEKRNEPQVSQPLTPAQKKAFTVWKKAFKTDTVTLPSLGDIVMAGMDELRKYVEEKRRSQ
jgi:hypothetical protein